MFKNERLKSLARSGTYPLARFRVVHADVGFAVRFIAYDLLVLPVIILCSLLPLMWYSRNWYLDTDDSWYLLQGWNLLTGNGFTVYGHPPSPLRGPILPAVLAAIMIPFHQNIDHIVWTMRTLALLNPLLAYALVRMVFGRLAALLAAALVSFFSSLVMLPQAFTVDGMLLTVLLLFFVVLLGSVRRQSAALALLSGLLLGVAILTKETSFAYVPLGPAVGLLVRWRPRCIGWHVLGLLLVCLPWWVWVWLATGTIYLVTSGQAHPLDQISPPEVPIVVVPLLVLGITGCFLCCLSRARRIFSASTASVGTGIALTLAWMALLSGLLVHSAPVLAYDLNPLPDYLSWVGTYTTLWFLTPLALGFVGWKTYQRDRGWSLYLLFAAYWVPVQVLVTVLHYAPRQWVVLQTLLYGALAALFAESLKAGWRWRKRRRSLAILASAVAGTIVVLIIGAAVNQTSRFYDVAGHSPTGLENQANVSVVNMSGWISRNVPQGAGILVGQYYRNQLAYDDANRHHLYAYEQRNTLSTVELDYMVLCASEERSQQNSKCGSLRNFTWLSIAPDYSVSVVDTSSLANQMRQKGAAYLLITERWSIENTMSWVPGLLASGAFERRHASYLRWSNTMDERRGLVLLKLSGRSPRPTTLTMDVSSYEKLKRLITGLTTDGRGVGYQAILRLIFPQGIYVSGSGPNATTARREVRDIYGMGKE